MNSKSKNEKNEIKRKAIDLYCAVEFKKNKNIDYTKYTKEQENQYREELLKSRDYIRYQDQLKVCMELDLYSIEMAALYKLLKKALQDNNHELIERLKTRTPLLMGNDAEGNNLLAMAIIRQEEQMVDFAIENNVNILNVNTNGKSVLSLSNTHGYKIEKHITLFQEKFEEIIKHKLISNEEQDVQEFLYKFLGDEEVLKMILGYDKERKITSKFKIEALDKMIKCNKPLSFKVVLESLENISADDIEKLLYSAYGRNAIIAKEIFNSKFKASILPETAKSIKSFGAASSQKTNRINVEAMQFLLTQYSGQSINLNFINSIGCNCMDVPLIIATENGYERTVEKFLESINTSSLSLSCKQQALILAKKLKHLPICEILEKEVKAHQFVINKLKDPFYQLYSWNSIKWNQTPDIIKNLYYDQQLLNFKPTKHEVAESFGNIMVDCLKSDQKIWQRIVKDAAIGSTKLLDSFIKEVRQTKIEYSNNSNIKLTNQAVLNAIKKINPINIDWSLRFTKSNATSFSKGLIVGTSQSPEK